MSVVFAMGLLLTAARRRTGSPGAPIAMHVLGNAIAFAEAALAAGL